jgi:hypothetical protein
MFTVPILFLISVLKPNAGPSGCPQLRGLSSTFYFLKTCYEKHLFLIYNVICLNHWSRYSDWLRVGRPRGRSSNPGRVKNFLFSTQSRPALRSTQPPIQWVPGAKWSGREADHSSPTSIEVKKTWIYTSTSPYALLA